MPDRFLRGALLTSSLWNDLPVDTREFFIRLILVADDFGCLDGREGVCSSQCFPLNPPGVDQIIVMLAQLQAAGMIVRYSNAGKIFIGILQWKQTLRGRRRFPAPPVDIDLADTKTKGKFSRDIGWRNPPGYDDVSILLDAKNRPVNPQPDEWRPPDHFALEVEPEDGPEVAPLVGPGGQTHGHTVGMTHGRTRSLPKAMQPVMLDRRSYTRSHRGSTQDVGVQVVGVEVKGVEVVDAGAEVRPSVIPLVSKTEHPTTTANGEEIIKFENGAFVGLTEAQRVKWQEMWDDIRIPDQVSRAAEWLIANPTECNLYRQQDNGIRAFLVRWLLREARAAEKR